MSPRCSGTLATVVWDGAGDPVCELQAARDAREVLGELPPPRRTLWQVGVDDGMGHSEAIKRLFGALNAGVQPPTNGRDNLNTLALVAAALRSAKSRRWVSVEEVFVDARAHAGVECA